MMGTSNRRQKYRETGFCCLSLSLSHMQTGAHTHTHTHTHYSSLSGPLNLCASVGVGVIRVHDLKDEKDLSIGEQ